MDPVVLTQLILALFRSEPELRRFLNLVGLENVEQRVSRTKGGSLRATAQEAAEALTRMGLVDEALFEALARREPERAADIWQVARELGVGGDTAAFAGDESPPKAADETDVPEKYAAFAQRLQTALRETVPPDHEAAALMPPRWPWTAAASVLGSFLPHELKPVPGPDRDSLSAVGAFTGVAFTTSSGRWSLENRVRVQALIRLDEDGALQAALEANAAVQDLHRDFMRNLLDWPQVPKLTDLTTEELNALDTVLRWVEPIKLAPPQARAAVYAAVERRTLIDPLRKLVGKHFRGREAELRRLMGHVRGEGMSTTLAVFGPGGTGKSSLLGKVLLELERVINVMPLSFAHIDFDKARHDPRHPRGLVEQIARQLRLLYAVNTERSHEFAAVEATSAGDDVELAAEVLDLDAGTAELDLDGLIAEPARRLTRVPRSWPPALVLILDTFEEVQIQGSGAVADVRDLLDRLEAAVPGLRVVVSGRADLRWMVDDPDRDAIELGDLDAASADAVLESLGVDEPALRALVIERFGGNPLVLHLAAEALRRMGTAEHVFHGALDQADAVAAIGIEQVQGMLYERILGHIADPEVVKIAHPGLAVRRVDVGVIREVLSEPCGLDPDRAPEIFQRLEREISMFQQDDDGALRHRQDVRRLMLRTMACDPEIVRVVARIHARAIRYYERLTGPTAAAEEIYHRLMSGDDPRTISERVTPDVHELLLPALEDPLPERAREWLRRRLGLVGADETRSDWGQEDWEDDAGSRARSWLESSHSREALDVLRERSERLPGSLLYPLEVAALVDLGELDEAAKVFEVGMRSCIDAGAVEPQLALAEQATKLAVRSKDTERIVAASQAALKLSDLTGDPVRGISDLTGSVAALQHLGAEDEADTLSATIAQRFSTLPESVKRTNPELVRAVIQTAGATNSTVLAQAAASLGNMTSVRDAVFKEDAFALTRLLEGTRPESRDAMNELALEVGLAKDTWTPRDLATSAVRLGRTGQAVMVGLDWAKEAATARRTIVEDLAVPVDLEGMAWRSSI